MSIVLILLGIFHGLGGLVKIVFGAVYVDAYSIMVGIVAILIGLVFFWIKYAY